MPTLPRNRQLKHIHYELQSISNIISGVWVDESTVRGIDFTLWHTSSESQPGYGIRFSLSIITQAELEKIGHLIKDGDDYPYCNRICLQLLNLSFFQS